jgi:hypothetical protein
MGVSNFTHDAAAVSFNRVTGRRVNERRSKEQTMVSAIIVSVVIVLALGYGLRSRRSGDLIDSRPYNNRYSDATAARQDHLG